MLNSWNDYDHGSVQWLHPGPHSHGNNQWPVSDSEFSCTWPIFIKTRIFHSHLDLPAPTTFNSRTVTIFLNRCCVLSVYIATDNYDGLYCMHVSGDSCLVKVVGQGYHEIISLEPVTPQQTDLCWNEQN